MIIFLILFIFIIVLINYLLSEQYELFISKKNILSFQCIEGTNLEIYKNDTLIKKIDYTSPKEFQIENLEYYDSIIIIANNKKGKGGFIGNWTIDGKKYLTNKSLFTLEGLNIKDTKEYRGGKDIGCFRDNIDKRVLPTQLEGISDIQRCHDEALKGAYPYYALQNGSQCFMGYNYLNSQLLDDKECFIKCIDNKDEFCGGPTSNRVYSSFQVPEIKEYDKDLEKKNKIINKKSKWIWIESNNMPSTNVYGQWKFIWTYIPQDIEFCPNPSYCEFNKLGCYDKKKCSKTVKKGYKINKKLCKTKLNSNFIGLDNYILEKLSKIPKENRTIIQQNFLRKLYNIYQTSCLIIKENNYIHEYRTLCGLEKIGKLPSFQEKCSQIPLYHRNCPSDIKEKYQKISKDSLGEEWLKNICINNNYCFDSKSKEGPKCFKPNKINIDDYIDFYDYQIPNSIELAGQIVNKKKTILNNKWIKELKNLKTDYLQK